jgi:hypothetical protein
MLLSYWIKIWTAGILSFFKLLVSPCLWLQVLPWGGEFTAESLQFFSPALLWTRPSDRTTVQTVILEAFKEYVDVSTPTELTPELNYRLA